MLHQFFRAFDAERQQVDLALAVDDQHWCGGRVEELVAVELADLAGISGDATAYIQSNPLLSM